MDRGERIVEEIQRALANPSKLQFIQLLPHWFSQLDEGNLIGPNEPSDLHETLFSYENELVPTYTTAQFVMRNYRQSPY
jgi:hypothetical protein